MGMGRSPPSRAGDDPARGLVDRPPPITLEADALLEGLFRQGIGRDGEMLPDAGKVHEPQVDRGDLALSDLGQDFFGSHRERLLMVGCSLILLRHTRPRRIAIGRAGRSMGKRIGLPLCGRPPHDGRSQRAVPFPPLPFARGAGTAPGIQAMPRFVLLEHRWEGIHWDLMLERGGVLCTWAIDAPVVPEADLPARALPDHRRIYLEFQGDLGEPGNGAEDR